MFDPIVASPVLTQFRKELKRLQDLESKQPTPVELQSELVRQVPKRRIVKLPPTRHPLFPDLTMS